MTTPRLGLDDFHDIPASLPSELDSWHPYYLSGVDDASTVLPTLGCGFIYPGLRHVFSGPQESAKTLAAYVMALDIIRQDPGNQILLLDFEMGPRGAKRRWRDCGATDQELDNQILYLAPDKRANMDRILILVALAPKLVIIDAAAGAFDNEELDDNKRADAERWRKLYVDPFFDNGIATLTLDHVVKNTENRGKYTIGSERKTGGGEVHIGFDTIKPIKRGATGIYKMTLHKDREGHHNRGHFYDLHISSDPDTHTLSCEFRPVEQADPETGWMPTGYMEKVSLYLLEHGTCSRTHLCDNVEGGTEYVRQAIDALKRLGYVKESKGSRNSRQFTNTQTFLVSEWESKEDKTTPPDPASTPPRPGETRPRHPASPLRGGWRASDASGGNDPASRNGAHDDDAEVQAMLAHYDLLAPPNDDDIDIEQ